MQTLRFIQILVYVCRAIQVPVALIALGLTASLLPTFNDLRSSCTTAVAGVECRRIKETVGGLRFSIATGVLALIDAMIGWLIVWKPNVLVLGWIAHTLDSVLAGFYLGSGSTIAARLNGELCAAGPSDPTFACGRLFADMGFMFVGAMTCYALVACFWVMRGKKSRAANVEASEGHALEDPFRDPPAGAEPAAESDRSLNKRRSWSQLS